MSTIILAILSLGVVIVFTPCDEDGNVNSFSLQDDVDFGRQPDAEREANAAVYPIPTTTAVGMP